MREVYLMFLLLLSIHFFLPIRAQKNDPASTSQRLQIRQFDLPKTAPTVRIIKLSQSILNKSRRKSHRKSKKHSSTEEEYNSAALSMSTERDIEFDN